MLSMSKYIAGLGYEYLDSLPISDIMEIAEEVGYLGEKEKREIEKHR